MDYRLFVCVLALAVLVAAQPALPVQLSYATSGSMAPAIESGDLYVVVETTNVNVGDVITYRSPTEGFVTHRIVGRAGGGFVTKGDANSATDQAAGLAPVSRADVVGRVVTAAGEPLTVPGIGPALVAIQAHRLQILLVAGALLAVSLLKGNRRGLGIPRRDVLFVGDIVRPLFVAGILGSLLLVAFGGSVHDLTYVATNDGHVGPGTVVVGEPAVKTVVVEVTKFPFTEVFVEAEGVEILDRAVDGSRVELDVLVPAQGAIGPHRATVHVYAYPATLPRGVLGWLHGIHWFVAALVSIGAVFGPLSGLYWVLFDGRTIIRWPRSKVSVKPPGGD